MRDELAFENCRRSAAEASSLPPLCYVTDDAQRAEVERFFRHGWVGVGRSDMVAGPGAYITLDFAGQTVLLLRDKDGQLRAYANSCRHRGARLVDGEGTCKGIRCPFHSWFYALDGRLVSAPQMEAATGFDRADNGLIAYRAEERAGFVFVCLDQAAGPLDDHLGDFLDLHASWPLAKLQTVRRRALEVDCNWKMFLEVFNEYYHLPFVHPDTIDSIYAAPDPADQVTGAFATQFGRTEGTGALLETAQDSALPDMPGLTGQATQGARYTWVFPNMTFAANKDALWCYVAYPLAPNRCKVVQTACFHPDTCALPGFDTRVAAYLERLDAALAEDVPALVNQQRGMECPDAVPGRFQPDLEPNVASFARWYSNAI
ncbi:aromatic ring-hydroxylating dioxygenase subunit alpha [Tropicibacter sp. R16_0]|uniref:aromatic ring-hydroxylating oxygenase subunit alpha n=1 Tax=Tropicibacter sp. R16_0 TaxID=2821102 RepID=UPI001ADCCB1D|nr:aromatic ring-hydroxylating dioxygenase subunit alpha [Tropicibacter sp. R16_0]MBO9450300.1 aromatic ring-hydroxylating dioxygenase subunit alpha [Tropicibacter sp. R16_0]